MSFKKYISTAILSTVFIIPISASAATVYIEASRNTISVGDTAIIAVKINADGAVLNTIDGEVTLKSTNASAVVQEFSLANSNFGLWPRTPSLSKDGKSISFIGGVPGGFSIEGATLFKAIVEAKKPGILTISPQNISVYVNDGKGTKVPVQTKDIVINIISAKQGQQNQNDWAQLVSTDRTPPEDFIIVLGQDKNLFSGKKFAYFSAIDNQSGIDHYDVSENGAPAVRSGSTYVLQDQSDNVKLDVVAYDKANNRKSSSLKPATSTSSIVWVIIVAIIILIVIIRIVIKKKKSVKNNVTSGTIQSV